MHKWNRCRLVYKKGSGFIKSYRLGEKYKARIRKLIDKFGDSNAWVDLKTGQVFSTAQNSSQGAIGSIRAFLCPPEDFLTSPDMFCPDCGGKVYCDETLGKVFGTDTEGTSEFLIQRREVFEKVKDKTVMIVGAGPSAVKVDWERYNYDYLWSCNHFFMNEKLRKKNVDLWIPSDEVDLINDENLHQYLNFKGKDSWCCLYPTRKRDHEYLLKVKEKIPNVTYSHLRYRSKIGIMPRLIILATLCGAKEVLFVGMDGVPSKNIPHAFQPKKQPKGTAAMRDAQDIFRKQYVQLWDYLLNDLNRSTEYFNLGEGVKSNLTTDISVQEFPNKRLKEPRYRHLIKQRKRG